MDELRVSASDFLTGAGAMGACIRDHDWSASPLGPIETWPQALRIMVGAMLRSKFPACLAWGPELIMLYNDAYLPLLGAKPDALGQPMQQVWAETWDAISPIVESALRREASYFEDLPLTIKRHGCPEETWWTFSYSPIPDEAGEIRGMLAIVQETTTRVLTERRLRFLIELKGRLRDVAEPRDVMVMAAEMLGRHLGATRVGYGEIDAPGEFLSVECDWSADATSTSAGRYRLDAFGAPIIEQLRAGHTVHVSDASVDPRTAEEPIAAEFIRAGKLAIIIVPLIRDGQWIAALYVHQAQPRHWREEEVALTEEVAERTWTAVLRVRAETALKESEERYRQLSEVVPQIVWSADAEGHIDFFNSRWFAYTGLSDKEGYLEGWEAAIHADDRSHILEARAEAIRTGTTTEFEYRLRRADGVYRWHMSRAVPVRNDKGEVVRWIGTFTDIDDRKRAEEALRESEERFRQFAEHSTAVFWTLDVATMQPEFLSPSFQQVWGEAPEAVPRDFAQWMETIHPDDREAIVTALRQIREEGQVVVREYRILRPDGTVRWIQNTGFPIRDEHGQVVRVAGIAQDITQHDGSLVYVVDGDETSRRKLSVLLQGAGYQVKGFATAKTFLQVAPVLVPGCVVLNVQTPAAGELLIPRELKARRLGLPVIVIGDAHGDVAIGVQAMKAGASDFLDISSRPEQLLGSVATALASIRDLAERDQAAELAKTRIAALPAREREVLDGLLAGGTNKMIARALGISPRTVEAHRARIMERLGAQSLPELVQIAVAAGLQTKAQES
jgi:PAS domain S-box-containing protein